MRIRYWAKNSLTSIALFLIVVPVYMVLFNAGNEDFAWNDLFLTATIYLLLFGMLFQSIFVMSAYKSVLPIALSFGSTRREAVVGCQVYRLLPLAALLPLSFLTAFLHDPDFCLILLKVLPAVVGAYLIFCSFGSLLGVATVKFGNKALFLLIPLCIGLTIGVFAVVLGATEFPQMPDVLTMDWVIWLVLGVGVILHGLSLIPEIKTVYHMNVKL